MVILKKIKIKDEKELHSLIEKELDALEEGLSLIKYEFDSLKGIPDFLCVDSGGRLVIIEVKLQEDENILFQALRYYNTIDQERYIITGMFPNKKIDTNEHPRIVLVAENFSDDIRRLSTLVVPDVELYEYTVLSTDGGKEGLCYHSVSLSEVEKTPSRPKTIEELKNYIMKKSLRPLFEKIRKEIKNIGEGIEEYATQSYVGFKYRGRQFSWLAPHRTSFDIGVHIMDENSRIIDYEPLRIEIGNEDYSETFKKVKESFEIIGGKLK